MATSRAGLRCGLLFGAGMVLQTPGDAAAAAP